MARSITQYTKDALDELIREYDSAQEAIGDARERIGKLTDQIASLEETILDLRADLDTAERTIIRLESFNEMGG